MKLPVIPDAAVMLSAAKASLGRPTDWEVAFHEAGHVVAEVALSGSFPDSVYISEDGTTDHAGRTTSRTFLGVEQMPDDSADPILAGVFASQRHRYAAIVLAGDLATDLALDLPIDPYEVACGVLDYEDEDETTTDTAKVRALTAGLRPGDAEAFVEEATQAALGALRSRWAEVRGVAAALVERRTLDRDALYDLLDATLWADTLVAGAFRESALPLAED